MVRRMAIPPGPYRFDRLPLNTGLGDVKVVVRDRLGREQTYASSVYLASGVLRRGDQDYRYVAGVERDDSGTTPVYGTAGAEAYHRIGFTDWLTAGYSAEGSRAVAAGGPNLAMRLGRLGEINVEAWGSRTEDGTRGAALYGLYAFTSANLNVNATAQYYDSRFANLSMAPDTASTPEFYQASASVPMFGAGSLTYSWDARRTSAGSYGFTTPDGAFDATLVRAAAHSLRGSARLFPGAQLTATATMTLVRGERQWSGFAGFNVALSAATTASVTYSSMPGIESTYADVDRSLPVGVGYGYRLTASDADGGSGSGQFEVNLPFTHVRLNYDAQKDREANGAGTIAGSLIVNRGGLFLTRELDASAAVVEVTGLPRVRVLADNVPIGRTNRHGRLLIPDLLPYLGNRISFDESDIPFDYSVPVLSQLVAPPFRGAAYVKFDTARIHARTGSIRMTIDGTDVTPAYGVIVVALGTGEVQSPLNADGEFFLDLPDGRHTATVTFKGRSCAVTIDAVPITGLAQKLGTLRCAP
jgi:outer membrane usher protein